MTTLAIADYKDTPREELTAKISKLLKLNYEVLHKNPVNTKFNYDEVAKTVVDEKITPSNDFTYTNIMKIIEEFVYNQCEIAGLLAKEQADLLKLKTDLENYKTLHRETMTHNKEYEIEKTENDIIYIERSMPLLVNMNRQLIYEQYQPDEFACKPRDYEKMVESLDKFVGNRRIKAFADWYANGSDQDQIEFDRKYAEYFESLDDLITLHEISLGIIPIHGLNLDGN